MRPGSAAGCADAAQQADGDEETPRKIAECDHKRAQYRAALDAGANPATVAAWIAETEAEKASCALVTRRPLATQRRMTEAEFKAMVEKFGEIARVLSGADPDDKAEVFGQLGLKLTYQLSRQDVEAEIRTPDLWQTESVRGPSAPKRQHTVPLLTTGFALDGGAR